MWTTSTLQYEWTTNSMAIDAGKKECNEDGLGHVRMLYLLYYKS